MYLIYACAIVLLIIVIIEAVLSGTWNVKYFSYAIPIFSKEIELSNIEKTSTEMINFINNLDTVKGFKKYKGKILDENTFAFRQKMITVSCFRNDFENIHEIISIDPDSRTLKVKVYARYSFLAAMLYGLVFWVSDLENFLFGSLLALFFILLMCLIAYAFDRRKYNQLCARILEVVN